MRGTSPMSRSSRLKRRDPDLITDEMRYYKSRLDRETDATGFADETNSTELEPQSTYEDLIGVAEAAEILGCSEQWVRKIRADLDGREVSSVWISDAARSRTTQPEGNPHD